MSSLQNIASGLSEEDKKRFEKHQEDLNKRIMESSGFGTTAPPTSPLGVPLTEPPSMGIIGDCCGSGSGLLPTDFDINNKKDTLGPKLEIIKQIMPILQQLFSGGLSNNSTESGYLQVNYRTSDGNKFNIITNSQKDVQVIHSIIQRFMADVNQAEMKKAEDLKKFLNTTKTGKKRGSYNKKDKKNKLKWESQMKDRNTDTVVKDVPDKAVMPKEGPVA